MKALPRVARLVAVFLMAVAGLLAAAPNRAAAATDPCAQVPVDTNAIGSCNGSGNGGGIGGVMPSAAPTSTAPVETTAPSAQPSAAPSASAASSSSGAPSSTPCDTTTAPCQWAQSSQSGAAAVAKAAADQYKNGLNMLGSGFLVPWK